MPNGDNDNDLERLINEAEAKVPSPSATEQPKQPTEPEALCTHANSDVASRRYCKQCRKSMCQFCWSVTDPNYCIACMDKVILNVTEGIFSDDDGVLHHGRVLTPTPQFNQLRWTPNGKTTAQLVGEMDEAETLEYVREYREEVHRAEAHLDVSRTRLNMGLQQLDELKARKRRSLQGAIGVSVRTGKPTGAPKPRAAKAAAKQAASQASQSDPGPQVSLNFQQLAQAIAQLRQQQEAKAKQNKKP